MPRKPRIDLEEKCVRGQVAPQDLEGWLGTKVTMLIFLNIKVQFSVTVKC